MKAMILAGGIGSRLGNLTKNIPKPLLQVGGKSLLEHQVLLLKSFGIRDIVILTGYLGEKIHNALGNGSKFGVKITYSHGPLEWNTGDRVFMARENIKDDFLLLYGDVMMNFDVSRLVKFHLTNKFHQLATLVVHPNNHPFDSDLVETDAGNRITAFHSKPHPKNKFYQNLVNAGAYVMSPKIFPLLKKHPGTDFGRTIFRETLKAGKTLLAYNTPEYFKDMGTLRRLDQVKKDYKQGIIKSASLQKSRAAVFLDRDGVINHEVGKLKNINQIKIYPFAAKAIRKINDAGYLAVIVTNQPWIARGYFTEAQLRVIHNKLEWELGKEGAKIDAIYYCPHHPIDKTVLHPVKKYAIDCDCRKPKPSLFFRAAKDLSINLNKSFYIGDTTRDAQAAQNAGVKFLGVKTGYGCAEEKFKTKKPYKVYKNLLEAVNKMIVNPRG